MIYNDYIIITIARLTGQGKYVSSPSFIVFISKPINTRILNIFSYIYRVVRYFYAFSLVGREGLGSKSCHNGFIQWTSFKERNNTTKICNIA